MNFKMKLESKEGKWIRIHFIDSSYFTGVLRHIGNDFLELECYGREDSGLININDQGGGHTQHVIPFSMIKYITVEANVFIEAERKRLEYIAGNTTLSQSCRFPDIEN